MNTWSQLPWKKKMKMIDSWTVIIILSNWFHIFGIIVQIIPQNTMHIYSGSVELLMGMGTFLIWLSLLKYFQYS